MCAHLGRTGNKSTSVRAHSSLNPDFLKVGSHFSDFPGWVPYAGHVLLSLFPEMDQVKLHHFVYQPASASFGLQERAFCRAATEWSRLLNQLLGGAATEQCSKQSVLDPHLTTIWLSSWFAGHGLSKHTSLSKTCWMFLKGTHPLVKYGEYFLMAQN